MLNSRIISHYCKLFCAAANRENTAITGGHVLEHEGKKVCNAGMQAGKEEGKKDGVIEILVSLVMDKILSVSEAAKRANMTQPEFEKLTGL